MKNDIYSKVELPRYAELSNRSRTTYSIALYCLCSKMSISRPSAGTWKFCFAPPSQILQLLWTLAQHWAVSPLCGTAKSCPTCALGLESMPALEQAVKAQDVGRVDEARAHLTSRCGGWCLGRKSDEARRQCTWIRSRKQVLSSKVSMICCLWLVLILADQGSAESLVLMA